MTAEGPAPEPGRGSAVRAAVARALLAGGLPLGCYWAALTIGARADLSLADRIGFSWAILVFALALFLTFARTGWFVASMACGLALVLFSIPLSALWRTGASTEVVIGGLLPYSDASGYYHCARLVAEGETFVTGPFSVWCSRRPMFTSVLAGVLALTGQDLRQTIALLVLVTTVACFLAAREVRASHGAAAAAVFLITPLLFYRRFAGSTLTEHLGLALGALGFASLWSGARRRDLTALVVGLFLLTTALTARAGAFLVLPAIALWGAVWFAGPAGGRWRSLALACGAVAIGFASNALLVRMIGTPAGQFSNFSYTLYGLVFGGDWTLAWTHYPDLAHVVEPEQSRRILGLAVRGILDDPMRLVNGSLRAWRQFVVGAYPFAFAGNRTVVWILTGLAVAGLAHCGLRRREPTCSLLLSMAAGLVASVPFAPPWDADLMRAYAATVPVLGATAAVGAAWITRRWPVSREPGAGHVFAGRAGTWLGVGLVAFALIAPLMTTLTRSMPRFAESPTRACDDPLYVREPLRSMIRVVRDDAERVEHPLELRERQFRRGLRDFRTVHAGLARELAALNGPFVLFNALTLQPPGSALIAVASSLVPEPGTGPPFWRICPEGGTRPGVVRARSVERASPVLASGGPPRG